MAVGKERLNKTEVSWSGYSSLFFPSLRNFILSVLTLGLYYLWGKTEVRKHIWASVFLDHQPFEFTGTPTSLLRRLFIGSLFLLPPMAALVIIFQSTNVLSLETISATLIGSVFLLLFVGYWQYSRRDHQLRHILWRGMRGSMTGSALSYAVTWFWTWLLIVPTLGWIIPLRDYKLNATLIRETRFGDQPLTFEGSLVPLYKRYAVFWFGSFILILALAYFLFLFWGDEIFKADETAVYSLWSMLIWVPILIMFTSIYLLLRATYQSAKYNMIANSTQYLGTSLRLQTTGFEMANLYFKSLFFILMSFGILLPFVRQKWMQFFVSRLSIKGPLNYALLNKSKLIAQSGVRSRQIERLEINELGA